MNPTTATEATLGRSTVPERWLYRKNTRTGRGTLLEGGLKYEARLTRAGWILTGDYTY